MGKIGVVVLAAGSSARMGQPKQLLRFDGKTLLRRAAESVAGSSAATCIVVLGPEPGTLRDELRGLHLHIAENPNAARGIGTSIRAGIEMLTACEPEVGGGILMLCDQPLITASILDALIGRFSVNGAGIVACEYGGTIGVPALFHRDYFSQLRALPDDRGAKLLIERYPAETVRLPCPEAAVDLDTPVDWEKFVQNGCKSSLESESS